MKKLLRGWFGGGNASHQSSTSSLTTGDQQPTPYSVTHSWICNLCFKAIHSGQTRYKSMEIKGVDLCVECYETESKKQQENERDGGSELLKDGYFVPSTLHKFQLKEKVNDYRSNKTIFNAFVQYADYRCFGVFDDELSKYHYSTYRAIQERILNFSSGLVQLGLIPHLSSVSGNSFSDRTFVVISGKNCVEWFIADYACLHKSLVSLPIHFTLNETEMKHIVLDAHASVIICTTDLTQKYLSIAQDSASHVHTIVEIGREKTDLDRVDVVNTVEKDTTIRVMSFEYVESNSNDQMNELVPLTNPSDMITIIYTSGSTGTPKGAMIPDSAYNHNLRGIIRCDPEHVFSFCPLAHMSDRKHVAVNICNGSTITIFQRDMADIFTHIQIVRPTVLVSTPRLWNILYGEYQKELMLQSEKSSDIPEEEVERRVMSQFKTMLGDRLEVIVTGGAPTSPAVLHFLKACYQCIVNNGYGATEVGGIMSGGYLKKGVQYKLVDVPELNYFSTDKPFPRGELCVKTQEMFSGYFNNDDLTNRVIDKDGFHHTGDIVVQKSDKKFEIIDRLKNIFKLAQGEFVAPEYLEIQYVKSPYIDQVFIYGDSLRSYVLAVVVPSRSALVDWCLSNKLIEVGELTNDHLLDLCDMAVVRDLYSQEFVRIAKDAKLQPYEIPRSVVFDVEPFSNENGRLTALFKISRIQCELYYKEKLNALYLDLQEQENKQLQDDLLSLLSNIMVENQGEENGLNNHAMNALGIDSLHAVKFANMIRKKYNVDIPVKLLVGSATITDITNIISGNRPDESITPTISWKDEVLLDSDIQPIKGELTIDYCLQTKTRILLTGATGFLGIFLLHEILTSTHCIVYCVVRVKNSNPSSVQEAAMRRIISLMSDYCIWSDEYRNRIVPVVGDLSQPKLGLSDETFVELAEKIDVIYHNGAFVNSVLPYHELKAINVDSTKDILRLATSCRLKVVHYVSTISVVQGIESTNAINEQCSFSDLESEQAQNARLSRLSGYSSSKWVAEQLCHEARRRGVPVTIFRPGMIGPHRTLGVCNLSDWVVRFIRCCMELQCYPRTGEKRIIDLSPVDVVSKVIIALSQVSKDQQESINTYHILNPDASVSFDAIFNIISEANPTLTQCPQFYEWQRVLNARLDNNEDSGKETLWPLKVLFRGGFPSQGGTFTNENTMNVLRMLSLNNLLPAPINREYVLQFIDWIQKQKQ